jgi:hypothetical protein
MRDQLLEVAARHGLAAGEMHLQHAHRCRLVQDAAPSIGVELLPRALELERVRAIGTLQWTAMSQLRKDRKRRINLRHG